MMKRWKQVLVAIALMVGLTGGVFVPAASAVNVFEGCTGNADSTVCKSTGDNAQGMIKSVINLLLYVLGIIAVLMIIVGGVRYTTSAGNASQTKEAKDTILYSVVGLVVAIMAFTIINFVLGAF